MTAKWQQGPPNVCHRALVGDRGQDLFDCLAMFMGFVQAARPQHMVSEHIYQAICQAEMARGASTQMDHAQS
eukprot:1664924-Prorocentrum_lima.AAC.1